MPELPEVEVYVARLRSRLVGQALERVRIRSFLLVRSFDPPVEEVAGTELRTVVRLGKRIRYAENEMNYCAGCQTGGKLLSDRSPARLLKDDWPKTLNELEERRP